RCHPAACWRRPRSVCLPTSTHLRIFTDRPPTGASSPWSWPAERSSLPPVEQEPEMPEILPAGHKTPVRMTVNGLEQEGLVEPRRLLVDFLREDLGLTGTHIGCEHGVCGACTVLVDGQSVRACLMFAVQANGRSVMTVEALAGPDGSLHPIQQAFW